MLGRTVLVGLFAVAAASTVSAQDLGELLGRIAPQDELPKGSVAVFGWVEQGRDRHELVVSVEPRGAAKLVADPGILVEPQPSDGVVWLDERPVERVEPGGDYFDGRQELRIPFRASGEGEVAARVEYAYCLVDYQCLFGEALVTLPAPLGAGPS